MPSRTELLPMSLVTFSRGTKENIHLLYTLGFEGGPGIQRNGQGSPWMVDPDTQQHKITDPIEQRKGTWFINDQARRAAQTAIPQILQDIETQRSKGYIEENDANQRIQYLTDFSQKLRQLPDYETVFANKYPDLEMIGMQGCGNLTMNEWYVAYLKSPFTDRQPVFMALPEDLKGRLPPRQYSCFVKYQDGRLEIRRLHFNFVRKCITLQSTGENLTDRLEFAVYGTQLLRDGELVDFRNVIDQIADVRHLFKLPNLNPTRLVVGGGRPRRFFGRLQYDDVWFGEAELLNNIALRRAALTEPALFNRQYRNMGADAPLVREVFRADGYREDEEGMFFPVHGRGSWRFREETDELVEVQLLRNVYAYSLLGLDEAGDNIYAMAVSGLAGRRGQTLDAAVQNIKSYGAHNAILIDQGDDVFQYAVSEGGKYVSRVPLRRWQIRAVFAFAKPKEARSTQTSSQPTVPTSHKRHERSGKTTSASRS